MPLLKVAKSLLSNLKATLAKTKPIYKSSDTDISRVAASRIYTALLINDEVPYELHLRLEKKLSWLRKIEADPVKISIIQELFDTLHGKHKWPTTVPAIRQTALKRLDHDVINSAWHEDMWEFEYRNRAEKAQREGKVEAAEMYEVMADTVVFYKGYGVFEAGEYLVYKAGGKDGRTK